MCRTCSIKRYQRQYPNVAYLLLTREYCRENHYRTNMKIITSLVCKGNYEFRKVWKKTSKQNIYCEGAMIFSDNFRTVHSGYGPQMAAPVLKYSIPLQKTVRFEDALLQSQRFAVSQATLTSERPAGPILYAVASTGLFVFDVSCGKILHQVGLLCNDRLSWKDIFWTRGMEMFVMSTTLARRVMSLLAPSRPSNVLKSFAIFEVLPLRFCCLFDICRSVFGDDIRDATYAPGLLCVTYWSGLVRLYDLEKYLEELKISSIICKELDSFKYNLKIKEEPQCVFQIQSSNEPISFGMIPWHFLMTPKQSQGQCVNLYSVANKQLIKNGSLEAPDLERISPEDVVFHGDGSNRLICVFAKQVRIYELHMENEKSVLLQTFSLPFQPSKTSEKLSTVTTSGRRVKHKFSLEQIADSNANLRICNVEYEDDLELLWSFHTLSKTHSSARDSDREVCTNVGLLRIYDNATGQIVRTFTIDQPKSDYGEQKLVFDVDTIYQTFKSVCGGKFICQVYRLFEKQDKEVVSRPKQGQSRLPRTARPRSTQARRTVVE